jgi:hypothetical protein
MDKKHPNPLTLADLKEALTGLATKEDLKALAPQETVNAIMETVAETKESMTGLTGLMHDMLEELTATHDDVRSVRTTVTTLAQSDAAHEAAIKSVRKRLERVERKGSNEDLAGKLRELLINEVYQDMHGGLMLVPVLPELTEMEEK